MPSGRRGNSGQGPDTESTKFSDVLPYWDIDALLRLDAALVDPMSDTPLFGVDAAGQIIWAHRYAGDM